MVKDAVMVNEKEGAVKCAFNVAIPFYGAVKGSVKVKVQSRVHSRIQPNLQFKLSGAIK